MKQFILLRHAKSSWDNARLKDFERSLASRGKNDARIMGSFLKKIGSLPEVIISSPAYRAKETAQLFAKGADLKEDIITWDDSLYHGGASDYLEAIAKAPTHIERLLLVGHNPDIEEAVEKLCGGGHVRMATATLVCLEQQANRWDQVERGLAQLKWIVMPKMIKKLL